jgi:hypothetical protein
MMAARFVPAGPERRLGLMLAGIATQSSAGIAR